MERVFYDLIGFIIGASIFMLFYWIAGYDIPSERSPELLRYVVCAIVFGLGGMLAMDGLVQKLKWWLKHD